MRRSRKIKTNQAERLAARIMPAAQVARGGFEIHGVANHTDADQRYMVRSGEKKTVRKLTRIERLARAKIINADQLLACEWYASAYELGFQTIGCTVNYLGAGGGGFGAGDLFSRYSAQAEARENYHYARQAIPRRLLGIFEHVVLGIGEHPALNKQDKLRFGLAAFLLHGQIGHLLQIAA